MTDPAEMNGFMIRPIDAEDLQWLAETTAQRYPGLVKDWKGFGKWVLHALENPDILALRTEDAFWFAGLQRFFYNPSKVDGVGVHLASAGPAPWQIMALVRAGLIWARNNGASRFRFDSGTGLDFGPLCRRLGPVTEETVYWIGLEDVKERNP